MKKKIYKIKENKMFYIAILFIIFLMPSFFVSCSNKSDGVSFESSVASFDDEVQISDADVQSDYSSEDVPNESESSDEESNFESGESYESSSEDTSLESESPSEPCPDDEHVLGQWEVISEPDCQKNGESERKCEKCLYRETMEIPTISHVEEEIKEVLPNCSLGGYTSGISCSACGEVIVAPEAVPKLDHVYYKGTIIEPTCTEKGYTLHKCTLCGESYKDNYTSATHTYKETVVKPTCTEKGYTLHKCTACGNSYKDNYTSATHTYKETVVKPTCTEKGYTLYKCTACGNSYKDNYTSATHTYKETVVKPTCTEKGYTLYKCTACGNSYKGNETAKVSHIYTEKVTLPTLLDQGYTTFTCQKCGYSYNDKYTNYDSIVKNSYANNSKVLAMGIDVSKWNCEKDSAGNYLPLNWEAIKKSGVDYVIIKAGSTVGKDPTFEMHYAGAKKAGLDVGAYFYTYAMTPEEAVKDAKSFMAFIAGKKFEYPVYMDFEDSSQKEIPMSVKTKMIEQFAVTLQREGYYVGIYTGYYWLNPRFNILDSNAVIEMLDLWFAHVDSETNVGVDKTYKWDPDKNLGHSEFGMWQYTHNGVLSGNGHDEFDFNYAYKDYPSIIKKLGLNGYSEKSQSREYVWVIVQRLNVRSYWDTSTSENILRVANYGESFAVLEKTKDYVKIDFEGKIAYISADPEHVSFSPPN